MNGRFGEIVLHCRDAVTVATDGVATNYAAPASGGFVPQPGHSVSFGERPVLVEAAAEVVARL